MSQPPSAPSRPILTCESCRLSKLRCDKRKPRCSRCLTGGQACHYTPQEANKESTRSPTRRTTSPAALVVTFEDDKSVRITASKSSNSPAPLSQDNPSLISESGEQDSVELLPNLNRDSSPQKRTRTVVSCSRCRRLKVKCDRQHPCSRCWKYEQRCKYLPVNALRHARDAGGTELSKANGTVGNELDLFGAKHSAESHWLSLVHYARTLLGRHGVRYSEDEAERRPSPGILTSPNYPFVTREHNMAITRLVPTRPIVQLFVQRYFNTMGKLFRIIDPPVFELELQHFWEQPDEDNPGWMAQLLLIMGLGCDFLNKEDGNFAASHGHLPDLFLDQATVLLHRTPFMFRPDLCTIRTLCLMVLAKQMIRKSCFEEDASWCLTGMIKRLAMSLNLHLDQPVGTARHLESGVRKVLWTTILYLDLHHSVLSGLPILLEPACLSFAPSNYLGFSDSLLSLSGHSTQQTMSHTAHEEVFQNIFYEVFPLAHEVALAARSIDCQYETAVRIDKEVRRALGVIRQVSIDSSSPTALLSDDDLVLQWDAIYLDTLLRRLLLELHRRFVYKPQAPIHYSVSYWSTLDCAAAMLVLQRRICEKSESEFAAGQWLIGIFRSDFFVAGLTVSVYLIQNSSQPDSPNLPGGYATKTLLETLRSCRDIWARGKNFWICEFQKFRFFDQVITSLDQTTV